MRIEESNDSILKTLNLGCFPKNVLELQDTQDFFQQLVFIDYQLQLLIQNELDGNELVPAQIYLNQRLESTSDKLGELISYAENITTNYNDLGKQYHEKLYAAIILSHLYFLNSQKEAMFDILNSVTVNSDHHESDKLSFNCNLFLNYLVCRYNVLIGISNGYENTNFRLWIEYLYNKEKPFGMSEVAANYWLDILFKYLSLTLSNNGEKQLTFGDVVSLKFKDNRNSFIRYCNFLVNFKVDINVNRIVTKEFRLEYSKYLNDIIVAEMQNSDKHFPHAHEANTRLDEFVNNLYSSMKGKLISLKTSKAFLILLFERSYQSQIILANYIKVLIDLGEYDEALAAFKTYVAYQEKEEAINKGAIYDVLNIIEIYSICLLKFNPINSIKSRKFIFVKASDITDALDQFSTKLLFYLDVVKQDCNLSFDEDAKFNHLTANRLSFLFTKYNINILLSDKSDLIELISKSWFCLGYFQYYLLTFASPNSTISAERQKLLEKYYKSALIVNSTGNLTYLFNYSYILAYLHDTNSSVKLCKFILKKYPESFETWNLLCLIISIDNIQELEKFINNALNIAGIYIDKCKNDEVHIPTMIKYQIIQLKLTHLAILEDMYDTKYIMEHLSDVFILYYELFDIKYEEQVDKLDFVLDSKWSHRPSFIDPKPNQNGHIQNGKRSNYANDNIKKISKVKTHGELKEINKNPLTDEAKRILQFIWLWTSKIYFKAGFLEESQQCIVESESCYKPTIKTYIQLGYINSKQSKFLSLQEFEKSLEQLDQQVQLNQLDYLENLLGLCKLFLIDDSINNSLFISVKDRDSGIIRLKNLLEQALNVWPIGNKCIEVWYYLSIIYEKLDDKILLTKALDQCIKLETGRPVRAFASCEQNFFLTSW